MEAERPLWISEGVIRPSQERGTHWADPLLVNMNVRCEVMLCIQDNAMPRAYLLKPRFQPYYSDTTIHPHPRGDQAILHNGRPLPGLCVFSSAEMVFSDEYDFYTQFLDQLTQYVAKHLIWLRTRRLCRKFAGQTIVLYQPRPGEQIIEQAPYTHWVQLPQGPVQAQDFWSGYWPGKPAKAMTSVEHLWQISPTQRCWCGLNKAYGDCHRPLELQLTGAVT
ncbi:SEC-C metal-binding domain-containing protein [Granulicella sibirica]|uniref:SEC-C metal-binding domain-containing protein n=1 Tax=Granulicella sibirica TaxID=2479048 RepID=UPI003BAA72B5